FSSRRRHTRFSRDWSSDVCSSDLLQVYFRTAQSEVEPGAAERLSRIARLVRTMDGAVVLLEGHADPRGDEQYNIELSQARAESRSEERRVGKEWRSRWAPAECTEN